MVTRRLPAVVWASIAVAWAVGSHAEDWREDVVCGQQRRLADPVPTTRPGLVSAYVVQVSDSVHVCAGWTAPDDDKGTIQIEIDGRTVRQWTTQLYPLSAPSAFRVDAVDLTGDGQEELLIGTMRTRGNGMGITYWDVWFVFGTTVSPPVQAEDYGLLSLLTQSSPRGPCAFLSAYWVDGWEPGRGNGLYAQGRWLTPEGDQLVPAKGRPLIYRRYRYSFEKERIAALSLDDPLPLRWYSSRQTGVAGGRYPKWAHVDETRSSPCE